MKNKSVIPSGPLLPGLGLFWLSLLGRIVLGVNFLALTGWCASLLTGFVSGCWGAVQGTPMPPVLATAFAYVLVPVEAGLGLLLLTGRKTTFALSGCQIVMGLLILGVVSTRGLAPSRRSDGLRHLHLPGGGCDAE